MLKGPWIRRAALGTLERDVMAVVWHGGDYTVRDVQEQLSKPAAYTTVMTTLDRLFKKELVSRTRSGRAFVYTAALTREQFEIAMARGVLAGILSQRSGTAGPILSNLVDAVGSQADALDLLNALEDLVRDKRRRMEEER